MKKYIIFNWKCNPETLVKAKQLFKSTTKVSFKDFEIVICPPFPYIGQLKAIGLKIKIGAQNCFYEPKIGPFTGEVSPLMLKNIGCDYVILGHSERRAIGEDNVLINQKIKNVLKNELTPIVCLGETAQQKQNNETFLILEQQVREVLQKITSTQVGKIILAYEPIWAIGGGQSCPADFALTVALFIRKIISQIANPTIARRVSLLYGGSVDSANAEDYLKTEIFSGLLVGGASLKIKEFLKIASLT